MLGQRRVAQPTLGQPASGVTTAGIGIGLGDFWGHWDDRFLPNVPSAPREKQDFYDDFAGAFLAVAALDCLAITIFDIPL